MTSFTGLNPHNPTRYLGANIALNTVVTRNRAPTSADYRMPENGKLYPFDTYWLVAKDPTTGVQGDLWYLSKIAANVAYWIKLSGGGSGPLLGFNVPFGSSPVFPDGLGFVTYTSIAGTITITGSTNTINFDLAGGSIAVDSFAVDAFTAPGTNPVLPTAAGLVTITGGQVAAGTTTNVIRTDSLAANTYTIEVQRSSQQASSTIGANGVSHFDSASFLVDANGFVEMNPNMPYYSLTPYIVGSDVHSEFSTITAAVTQAVTDGASLTNPKNIHIKPQSGGYIEDVVLVDGINLVGQGDQVTIHGKVSMSTAGEASVTNLTLKTNGDYCLEITGSAVTEIVVFNCNLHAVDNTCINQASSNAGSIFPINNCFFFIEDTGITVWTSSSAGYISMVDCSSANLASSTTASTNSAGNIQMFNSVFDFPISCTATGSLNLIDTTVMTSNLNVTALTFDGATLHSLTKCLLGSGTASAVTIGAGATLICTFLSVNSSNMFVLTGAGTLQYAFIAFTGASSGHNVTVETALTVI